MTSAGPLPIHVAFVGTRLLAQGSLPDVARAVATAVASAPDAGPLLVFDADARTVELDLRGTPDEAAARAGAPDPAPTSTPAPAMRGRGRPQLGVVAREITLLPRHWEWLAGQPGGASVTLRRLVEAARRGGDDTARLAQERTFRFINVIAGNLPRYEEALRALFARDQQGFEECIAAWPQDVRSHAGTLSAGAFEEKTQQA
jgi:hypothetical protein